MFSPIDFSVKFKSDLDYFTKCLFFKKNANDEGIKHLLNNTKKSSGCYLKVHKYGPEMSAFILKLPLCKQGSVHIIVSHLASLH